MNIINSVSNSYAFKTFCNVAKPVCKIAKVALFIIALTSSGTEGKMTAQNVRGTYCPIPVLPNPLVVTDMCPPVSTIPYNFVDKPFFGNKEARLYMFKSSIPQIKAQICKNAREFVTTSIKNYLIEKSHQKGRSFTLPIEEILKKAENDFNKVLESKKVTSEMKSFIKHELFPSMLRMYQTLDLKVRLQKGELSDSKANEIASDFETQISTQYADDFKEMFTAGQPESLYFEEKTEPRSLNEGEQKFLDTHFNEKEQKILMADFDCAMFSYIYLRDFEILQQMITTGFGYTESALLKKYTPVKDPKPGDLVLYYDDNKVSQHHAVYIGGGRAISKFGIEFDIYEHGLFDVPSIYGNYIVFLRKK